MSEFPSAVFRVKTFVLGLAMAGGMLISGMSVSVGAGPLSQTGLSHLADLDSAANNGNAVEQSATDVQSWERGTTVRSFSNQVTPGGHNPAGTSDASNLSGLGAADQRATLEAIHYALSEVADGATFVWRRQTGPLHGKIRPTTSFRSNDGNICRHLVIGLIAGDTNRQIEGIACRGHEGDWSLSG